MLRDPAPRPSGWPTSARRAGTSADCSTGPPRPSRCSPTTRSCVHATGPRRSQPSAASSTGTPAIRSAAAVAARAVRRREIVRTAIADTVGLVDLDQVGRALSDAATAALDGGLRAASARVATRYGGQLPTRVLVVAMGRLGGDELGYGSDADVMFVHDPLPGAVGKDAQDAAMDVVSELRRHARCPRPRTRPGRRPEPPARGTQRPSSGPSRRTRGTTSAGRPPGGAGPHPRRPDRRGRRARRPVRRPDRPAALARRRHRRRRRPRDPAHQGEGRVGSGCRVGPTPTGTVKLGRGSLSDIEWTCVQLLQLRYAGRFPGLRTTSTTSGLTAAGEAGLITPADTETRSPPGGWRRACATRQCCGGGCRATRSRRRCGSSTASAASSGTRPRPDAWTRTTSGSPGGRGPSSSESSTNPPDRPGSGRLPSRPPRSVEAH